MLPDRLDFAVDYVNQKGQPMWDVSVLLDEETDGLVTATRLAIVEVPEKETTP